MEGQPIQPSGAPPASSTSPMRAPAGRQMLVIGVPDSAPEDAGAPTTEVIAGIAMNGVVEATVPGWRSAAVVGDVESLATVPVPGEWLGGFWALDDAGGLRPVTVLAIVRGALDAVTRTGFTAWLLLAVLAGIFFWAIGIFGAIGLVQLLQNRARLTITPSRAALDGAGALGFVVDAPFTLRAKVRYTRGRESRKRKVKASLVVVADGHEHAIPFSSPETLLRYAAALTAATGVTVARDIKYDGVKLAKPPF